ncbi:MAG: hypothetical protein MJZ64_00165 [Paludibacteraceae bacterium]|nr:hypothetical protein [Paludibacteraceae bacterium]
MKKSLILFIAAVATLPLLGQDDGYNANKTTYTTTLQHTPYSNESTTQTAKQQQVKVSQSSSGRAFECQIDLSGSLKATQIFYENVSTQSIPDGGGNIDVTFGVRYNSRSFFGAGIGFHTDFLNDQLKENHNGVIYRMPIKAYEYRLPIFIRTRLYMPAKAVNPFLEIAAGGYVRLKDQLTIDCSEVPGKEYIDEYKAHSKGGFYMQIGFGVEYKQFTTALGYRCYGKNIYNDGNYAYLSVGVKLGK